MRRTTSPLLIALTPVLLVALACSREPAPAARSTTELGGSSAQRVAAIRQMLTVPVALGSKISDAQFREERLGDGTLGPSDFEAFYGLTVAPVDIPVWLRALPPLDTARPTEPPVPSVPTDWWVRPSEFQALRFFGSGTISDRWTGWVGVDSANGRIFIYTFTQ